MLGATIAPMQLFGSQYSNWDEYKRDWKERPKRALTETIRAVVIWAVVLIVGTALIKTVFPTSTTPITDNRGSTGGVYVGGNNYGDVETNVEFSGGFSLDYHVESGYPKKIGREYIAVFNLDVSNLPPETEMTIFATSSLRCDFRRGGEMSLMGNRFGAYTATCTTTNPIIDNGELFWGVVIP